ncbi:MAG: ketoacyl-ACP synthase III [Anaerolineales bacterium]|nr:ketoacyl-ACP synthase III [Anaerolineales bacterium]MDD5468231.1 ketoacyl-ACP synthase III [Anaerolineales bacterium]
MYAHITGWGMAVPSRVLTNHDLAQMVETDNEWIVSRTGIQERHIANPEQTSASLAIEAALKALEVANLKPVDVDLIIVSTSTPEHVFPATACLVQDRLGAARAGAFDLSAACSGFIYALDIATQAIRTESVKNALVIGTETLSRFVDWEDRTTCILFGDGAGAFVLQAGEEPGGLISSVMRSDGSGGNLLILPAGGSHLPASPETVREGLHYIQMHGREVFRFATRVMAQATEEAVKKAHLSLEDISLIIPHQANQRIIETAARKLNFPMERVMVNVDRYGNTSTASIPIATCEAIQSGRLQAGDKTVFVGFGAGLTWGAAVVIWSGPFPVRRRVRPTRYRLLARLRSILLRLVRRIEGIIWGNG